jgi:hypothetical protein
MSDPWPVTGKMTQVEFIPGTGEMLGRDGREVWLADETGVTAVVAVDLTPFIVPGSARFTSPDDGDEP